MTVPSTRSSDASRRGRLLIKLSPQQFNSISSHFFDRIESALDPLQPPVNQHFLLERYKDEYIRIQPDHSIPTKEFIIKALPKKQRIEMETPISGIRIYAWNTRTSRWEDESDHHDLEGLLTRDLMRLCQGIPAF